GTIYILMVIAAMEEKKHLASLCISDITQLCGIICHPNVAMPIGQRIVNSLIPTITHLRNTYPVSFSSMFSYDILQELGLPFTINCGDMEASDCFFETFLSK
ncbi:hypothetical protein L208DRAFT_1292570, partial [Tricholoma matsutake]